MTRVRAATPDDLAAVLELDAACFGRPWTAGAWRAEIEAGAVLVIGMPVLALACAPIAAGRCELRRIAADPSARRRGLGRDLLAAVIDHARRCACEVIELEVAADNLAALALYEQHGFRAVGRRVGYYRDPPADALLMDLAVSRGGDSNDV